MKTRKLTIAILALSIVFCLYSTTSYAQYLWGTTFQGGDSSGGTIFRMNTDGSGFHKVYDFGYATGASPMGSLVQATNGKLYGTCLNGGIYESCCIYSYDPTTNVYTDLWDFDIATGDFPMSGLVQAPNGMLYGAAYAGGVAGYGVIYSFNPFTNVYTDLYELTGDAGILPMSNLLLASNGKLYGTTVAGGNTYINGGIYSYDIAADTVIFLHGFAGVTDGYPSGAMIQHSGLLYGMTAGTNEYFASVHDTSGSNLPAAPSINNGNIYSFDPATNTYTDLHDFDSVNGKTPYGGLFTAADGKMYGMTSAGGTHNAGTIFSYDPATHAFAKLFDFDNIHGADPQSDLMQSADGKLYGTTVRGGAHDQGVIFRFDPQSRVCTVTTSLDSASGSSPMGGCFTMVGGPSGIVAATEDEQVSVYPVPAHHELVISLGSVQERPSLSLTDVKGQNIGLSQPIYDGDNVKLGLDQLATGIYFLRITTADRVITKKIIRD